jgi:flagellar biosynthetic protein FliQ
MFTTQTVLTIGAEALWITLIISAPLLLAALATGLVIGIFQAATQINEMTLSFIPKLTAMFAVAVLAGPWMLATLIDFMRRLIIQIPGTVG